MARRIKNKEKKQTFLFLVCGKTEEYYIEHVLKQIIANPNKIQFTTKLDTEIFKSDKLNGFDQKLKKLERENRLIHCTKRFVILDLEGSPQQNQSFYKAYERIKNCYKEYTIITSLPSIEVWFLLHFCQCTSAYPNAGEVIRILKTQNIFQNYDKNLTLEQIKFLVENYQTAINNSQHLENATLPTSYNFNGKTFNNPHTQLHKLIETLKS